MRLPWTNRSLTVVDVKLIRELSIGDSHKHPPESVRFKKCRIPRCDFFKKHCLNFPFVRKSFAPIDLDCSVRSSLRNHEMTILPLEHERIRQVIVSFQRRHWFARTRLAQLDHRYVRLVFLVNKLFEKHEVFSVVLYRKWIGPELILRRNQMIEPVEAVVRIVGTRFEPVGERPLVEEECVPDFCGSVSQRQLT